MALYLLAMIIQEKRAEWAGSQVLQDHMAMGCGGVWAVVSFSIPLFGLKGLGVGGGLYVHQNTFPLSKHTTRTDTPPYT